MNQPKPTPQSIPPSVTELRALRSELALVKEELIGLRSDLKNRKQADVTDQVAKGVLIAGFLGTATWFLFAILLSGLISR
ncbi:hypothetical protein [Stenomitos frigidus]|uniref:Uncharacterized protein n=1 Tax=Stenomitos frigidus ULC18 TaxID=2107698 RepID=A0A2T1EBS4_9CYAN|nr:hypothetical protein [Stenomitos frigidus]PSB30145.1 hypothetical protein C7B82_09315 [Stenomitos frigidus ULC18]